MTRILGYCEYKGTNYQGWQKQPSAPSVQEEIEKALSKILNTKTTIYGSGRTDAGVHALEQTFHFDTKKENIDLALLAHSINCLLPDDIHILRFVEVPNDFHARYNAVGKIYEYRLFMGKADVFTNEYVMEVFNPFELVKFKEAIKIFEGKHNYQNFTSKDDDEDNFVRTIENIDVDDTHNPLIITLKGDGFMRYEIRYIIGCSIAYAKGQIDLDFINSRLKEESKERNIVSYKADSKGLFLKRVIYKNL